MGIFYYPQALLALIYSATCMQEFNIRKLGESHVLLLWVLFPTPCSKSSSNELSTGSLAGNSSSSSVQNVIIGFP